MSAIKTIIINRGPAAPGGGPGGASDVGALTTTGLTTGNMLRVKAGGGLEQRTVANVRDDLKVPSLSGAGQPADLGVATALINPTGADNSALFTAVTPGTGGNSISVAYATPAAQATTTVAVVANAITVTPGTKARMVVSGTLTSNGSTPLVLPDLLYSSVSGLKPFYTDIGLDLGIHAYAIQWSLFPAKWQIKSQSTVFFESADSVATPDLVTTWTPVGSATGTPVVTAGISSAAQVIQAVNASTPAAALVTATASGAVTGAVAAVAAVSLTGGGAGGGTVGDYHGQHYRDTLTGIWYRWTGSAWEEAAGTAAAINLDGGDPASNYGAIPDLDGGTP